MVHRGPFGVPARHAVLLVAAVAAVVASLLVPAMASAQDTKRVLLYTGTTGFRHTDGINGGRPIVQAKLQEAGYTVDWEDCTGNAATPGTTNCNHPDKNDRIFSDANLAKYDAILLLNSSSNGVLWNDAHKAAIVKFVQNGGGIAGVHNATDMGTLQETWNWYDGNNGNSVVGATMKGHAATNTTNVGQIQVADKNHLSTRDLPDTYGFGDEHYNFNRNVRGSHHVLATIDERTYTPGGNAMGQDHPITWCKRYDGDNVNDNTGTPKAYNDGRTWMTSMGHFGSQYTENNGDNNLVKQIVGGVRWVAGEGKKSDCSGTVWSSYTRQVLVADANNPIGIDVAKDGKVYWSEIGNADNGSTSYPAYESTGFIKMHDPAKPAGNKTTVATIQTRSDHGNSEDGVLGMTLQPDFDLADPAKRSIFVYYSPRNAAWPTTGNQQVVGYNLISRFTLNEDGTAVVPGSEREILRVPKAKIAGSPTNFEGAGSSSTNGPGHVGGAGLDFDSAGNLYLGVGDDVAPGAPGHNNYAPMDFRAKERWDARKTAQNSADLRGKIIRITPQLGTIAANAEPAVGSTYSIPSGNLFPVGTAKTRPEIYAMGFRQPFTVHTDPANPGIVVTGEYCHDNNSDQADRSPSGTCEWNLLTKPGNHGWPMCVGDNRAGLSMFKWNYATNSSTGERYDCNQSTLPSDIRYAPAGQTPVEPTFDGLDTLPGPVEKATIWKKTNTTSGNQPAALDFGDLSTGSNQPITGPIYRYDGATAGQGAFPAYYDGSWFINNRGTENGFWKEVKLREDNNQMLRVQDWLPWNGGVNPSGANSAFVIGTQFGPDGNLYMSRYSTGCCRNGTSAAQNNQIVKISFNVADECLTDDSAPTANAEVTGQAYPDRANAYVNSAKLRLTASDSGCAGVKSIEYRQQGATEWLPYSGEVTFDEGKTYTVEFRATDRKDNVAAVKTTTFEVLKINDTTPPVTSADATGNKDQRDYFVGSASVAITATDNEVGASGVHLVEYRTNGGAWTPYTAPVAFNAAGNYTVDYRATDKVDNTSDVKSITFRILSGAGCTAGLSDEFGGDTLNARWSFRHPTTPATGAGAPSVADGSLVLKAGAYSLDLDRPGPVGLIAQPLPAGDFTLVTKITAPGLDSNVGGQGSTYAQIGLKIFQTNNNWIKVAHTRNADGNPAGSANSYFEMTTETNGTRVLGNRQGMANAATNLPTWYMRVIRTGNTVASAYSLTDPESTAGATWVSLGEANINTLLPTAAGPRYIGAFGGNGSVTARYDYMRITPDPSTCETVAPTTTATLDPAAPTTGDTYNRSVKVNLSATDASGVEATEYRVNSNGVTGQWVSKANTASDATFNNQVQVSSSGTHVVEFRSTDNAANTEEIKSVTFKIALPVCDRSDEFDGQGGDLLARWSRHTRNGGTPTTGPFAPTLTGTGQLSMSPNDGEIDGAATGPINFIGQDLAALGDNWQVETQFTVHHNGGWQHVGLMVWQADNNFFRSTITHHQSGDYIYVEQSKDNPTSTEGVRQTGGGNVTVQPNDATPITIKMRYARTNGANSLTAQYQIVAPAAIANANWVNFPGTSSGWTGSGGLQLNPTGGPRRDSAGSKIGIISAGNFPTQTNPPAGPADVKIDYFRVTPDNCPVGADQTAPTTTATAAPAAPNGSAGWYTSDVNVTLAGNDGATGSGIERTEYKLNGGAFATYSAPIALTATGTHTIEYRSIDKNENVEETKTVTYKVDKAAPTSAATLEPATSPSEGPVTLTLAGTDQEAGSGVAKLEYQVNTASVFGALTASAEWMTYDAANKPKFTAPGVYNVDYRATDAAGNVETAKSIAFTITAPVTDTTAPVTTGTLDPAAPGAGQAYTSPVTVKFSATDVVAAGPVKTVQVEAEGNNWVPSPVSLVAGERIQWSFPVGKTEQPHDLWLVAPGGNPANPTKESPGIVVLPGDAPIVKTLTAPGTYTFLCKVHSSYDAPSTTWFGMVGTATVAEAPAGEEPTGVDFTEYRVKTGDAQGNWVKADNADDADPFASQVTIDAKGSHTVEFRSADKAGNVETTKSVAFSIQDKTQEPEPEPTVTPTPTPQTPAATPTPTPVPTVVPPAPEVKPSVKLAKPSKTTVAKFAKSGLKLRAVCTGAMKGTATVSVTSKVRKALKLKSTTLAKRSVNCKAGTTNVTLKPSKAMSRALKKVKKSIKVTVTVTVRPAGKPAVKTKLNVTLARK